MDGLLSVCYLTSRQEPHIEWFFASLMREQKTCETPLQVIVVDYYCNEPGRLAQIDRLWSSTAGLCNRAKLKHVEPKPNPWNGKYRLTSQNWFAAASARNTGLCLAEGSFAVFVDDLSVLMPGWLSCVREAMVGGYIACGAYKKVKKLAVREDGLVTNYVEFPGGVDNRFALATADLTPCPGNWLYGCSCAMPVEALLAINGWPELCDGLGSEDYCCGIALANAGYKFRYDRRMLTLESEEHHHIEPAFRREDWHFENGQLVKGGNGADDKSHRALAIALGSKSFPNHCDMRALRTRVLAGEPFPTAVAPCHDWFSGVALSSL